MTEQCPEIRAEIRKLCSKYGDEYWRELDRRRQYPEQFVQELTQAGWLAALIPEQYGGSGLSLKEASVILEEINRSGGNSAACHAQMYIMGALLRHGSEEQKRRYLPKIATGELRLQAFGVTEPDAGSDTTRIRTFARKEGDFYIINGGKIFTSRVQHSDLMLLLARTTPYDQCEKKTLGMSIFLVDLRTAGDALEVRPIDAMINHETNQLFFRDLKVPQENLIGEEGKGFYYILDGLNAERILVAAESIGDARWFIARAVRYGKERVIFGRPIAQNQGIQFPIAQAYAQTEAADLMRFRAAELFDAGEPCGPEANMAKLLASQAAWAAANATLDTYGGYGFASEYDVERKFRECRLFSIAPISNNMVLNYIAEHVLGMPRSY
ncbi:MAG: acyl-CoA/acyl-ACP dehydrogenase [Candidatus Binatia bacterium]|nr:acyl-CoA/acyl-ACP dehydrogenase [Candidatus Binatia bacterium]